MKVVKLKTYTALPLLAICVFVGGILLGQYYSTQSADNKLAQIAQCNTELQNWQKFYDDSPYAADFTNIKVYKVVYSQSKNDCMIADYVIIPAAPLGEAVEWLEIDSLGTRGLTYWSQTSAPMQTSQATKILDEQLAELQ